MSLKAAINRLLTHLPENFQLRVFGKRSIVPRAYVGHAPAGDGGTIVCLSDGNKFTLPPPSIFKG